MATDTEARHRGTATAAFAGLALGAGVLVLAMTRHVTFVNDEWRWIGERYQGGLDSLLRAHNDQLLAAPLLVYKALLHTVGLDHHWPYALAVLLTHLACVTLAFLLVRRRVGDVAAVVAVAPLLVLGSAWETVLWPPAAMTFTVVTAGLLAAWLALERPSPRRDLAACAALVAGTASSSAAVPFLMGVAVELVLAGRRRALWIPGVPLAAYAAWYAGYGSSGEASLDTVARTPQWMAELAGSTLAGVFGQRGDGLGGALLVLAVALLAWAVARRAVTPRLAGALVALLGLWALTGVARATSDEVGNVVRLVYPGAVLVVVAAAEALRGSRPQGRVLAVAVALGAFAVAGNLGLLRAGQRELEDTSAILRGQVAALELQAARAAPSYNPSPGLAPITAEGYLRTARLTGSSPAYSADELRRAPAEARAQADRVLRELALSVAAAPATAGRCTRGAAGRPLTLTLRRDAPLVAGGEGDVDVRLWRFADGPAGAPPVVVPAGSSQAIRLAPDARGIPWRARLTSPAAFRACRA